MKRSHVRTLFIGIAIPLLLLLCFSLQNNKCAYAGDTRYAVSYDDASYTYVAGGTKVKRKVYVTDYLYDCLDRITYNIVTSDGTDVMRETIDVGVNTSGSGLHVKEGGAVYKENLTKYTSGKTAYYFEVETDECCAFVFTTYYYAGDEKKSSGDSKVLYVKNIDSAPPTVKVKEVNHFINSVTCTIEDDGSRCGASGAVSYTVYQKNTTTGEETVFLTSDKLTGGIASFKVKEGKYEYYVTATDAVDNTSKKLLVARSDFDALSQEANSAFTVINAAPDDWAESFKIKLETAYSEYEIAMNGLDGSSTDQQPERYAKALRSVLDEYKKYLEDRRQGKRDVSVRLDNKESLDESAYVENTAEACAFVRYGESGVLALNFGRYDSVKGKEEELAASGGSDADTLYTVSVMLYTTGQVDSGKEFTVPLKIAFSASGLKGATAVQVTEENGKKVFTPCHVTEYANGKVVLNVKKANGTVYLFACQEKKKTSPLWWLMTLLIIPIGGAVVLIVFLRKKKSRTGNGQNQ